jgi:hypothetical protein
MVSHMKTTVEISDELLLQVKQVAGERNESMRSLLEEALRRFLEEYRRAQPRRPFHLTTFRGTGMAPGMTPQRALELANDRGGWAETGE